jgi:hypothetical protein
MARRKAARPAMRIRALALALATLAGFAQAAPHDPALEAAVKATYLYKFADYIEWPAGRFSSPADPLTLCVAGSDAITALVDAAAAGRTLQNGRPIAVRHVALAHERDCDILYLAPRREESEQEALREVRGQPVLTVSDGPVVGNLHAVIAFAVVDNRVRFDIDLDAAAQNRLAVSSKLLNLAVRVRPKL